LAINVVKNSTNLVGFLMLLFALHGEGESDDGVLLLKERCQLA